MSIVTISTQHISKTLSTLQEAGHQNSERVALWLGKKLDGTIVVEEVFIPWQIAEEDYFRIPRQGMSELLAHLRQQKLMIAAQVHSHPKLAFHSLADDKWAIVRHEAALSLVVPYFALRTSVDTFRQDVAVFELSSKNQWVEVSPTKTDSRFTILP